MLNPSNVDYPTKLLLEIKDPTLASLRLVKIDLVSENSCSPF